MLTSQSPRNCSWFVPFGVFCRWLHPITYLSTNTLSRPHTPQAFVGTHHTFTSCMFFVNVMQHDMPKTSGKVIVPETHVPSTTTCSPPPYPPIQPIPVNQTAQPPCACPLSCTTSSRNVRIADFRLDGHPAVPCVPAYRQPYSPYCYGTRTPYVLMPACRPCACGVPANVRCCVSSFVSRHCQFFREEDGRSVIGAGQEGGWWYGHASPTYRVPTYRTSPFVHSALLADFDGRRFPTFVNETSVGILDRARPLNLKSEAEKLRHIHHANLRRGQNQVSVLLCSIPHFLVFPSLTPAS